MSKLENFQLGQTNFARYWNFRTQSEIMLFNPFNITEEEMSVAVC